MGNIRSFLEDSEAIYKSERYSDPPSTDAVFSFLPVRESQIHALIISSLDPMPTLKKILDILSIPLTLIVNYSLSTGVFLDACPPLQPKFNDIFPYILWIENCLEKINH